MEGADEIREIAKADVIGDIGHIPVILGQQPRRMAQPRAKQVLMRSDTEHAREQPQEMERADAGFKRRILQGDVPMRMGIQPQRCFHCTAAVPRRDRGALASVAADHLDHTVCEHMSDFVEADVATPLGCRLRQFAQHHQFGKRRGGADLPSLAAHADRVHQLRRQEERQALVAADVIMRTDEFRIGNTDQKRARNQFM